jgi:hypothetical protein
MPTSAAGAIKSPVLPPDQQSTKAAANIAQLLIQLGITEKDLKGDFHRKIENPPYIPLSIEKHGDRLYFTHWINFPSDDDPYKELVIDAEMIFRKRAGKLRLLETATRNPLNGGEARGCDHEFAEMFSENLLAQGFGGPVLPGGGLEEDGLPAPTLKHKDLFGFDVQTLIVIGDHSRVVLKDPRFPSPPKLLSQGIPAPVWCPGAVEHYLIKYGRDILDETEISKLPDVMEALSEALHCRDNDQQAVLRSHSVGRSLANRAMAILYWGSICGFSEAFDKWALGEFEAIYKVYNLIGDRRGDAEVKVTAEYCSIDIENELFRASITWGRGEDWEIYTGSPQERPRSLATHPNLTQLTDLLFDFPLWWETPTGSGGQNQPVAPGGGDDGPLSPEMRIAGRDTSPPDEGQDGESPLEMTQPGSDANPQAQYGAKICAVADQIRDWLDDGYRVDSRQVARAMRSQFGRGSEGNWTIKDSHEAQEVGLIKIVRTIANDDGGRIGAPMALRLRENPETIRNWLTTLQGSLPTHSGRTDESNDLQQFSTPLEFGYLAYLAANPDAADILLEPSAGTGMLAALPSLVVNSMILNELSDRRADILRRLYGQEVFTFNAEQIHNYLPDELVPTLAIINPPFSSSPNITSRRAAATLKHVSSAIKRVAPGGRIVLISAHWFHPEGEWRDAFTTLQKETTLRLSAPAPGDIYTKHGTHMRTRISVFDKVPAPDRALFHNVHQEATLDDLFKWVQQLPPRQRVSLAAAPLVAPPAAPPVATPVTAKPLLLESDTDFESVRVVEYSPQPAQDASELSEGIYEAYAPQTIVIAGAKPHPSKLCESAAMSSVAPPMPTYRPQLPRHIIEEGVLSEAQIESVIYAGDAHSKYLKGQYRVNEDLLTKDAVPEDADGKRFRKGFFLGDGTGCGKGRQIAGIIADNWVQGRKRALWITEKNTLSEDAQRDWEAIGGDRKDIISLSKFKQGAPITIGSGILFCTYATLRSQARQGKKSRLEQIIDWLGPDFDGIIAFDECHAMGGALKQKTERGQAAGSLQGQAGIKLQNGVPGARVVYVSATGATKVESLAYANRLGLWQTGDLPFRTRAEFINQISNSGVAAMEVMARDMKALGLYLARTLSYDGVEYDPLMVTLNDQQKDIYNAFADVFQIIHQDIGEALEVTGAEGNSMSKAAARSAFEGAKLRFFDHLIVGLKTPTLIKAIEKDLEDGHSCLVSLISTNESIINRRLETVPVAEWNDLYIDVSPRDTILDYLVRCFPTQAHEAYQDGDEVKYRPLVDKDGNPVMDKVAEALRDDLIERVAFLPPVPGALEQILFHFGDENVSEVTGRSRRLLMDKSEGRIYAASRNSQRSNLTETQAFQDGKKRILVFSDAGGTGRSYHSDLSALNQQRRHCYMLQPGWRADRACQALGRAHRTAQKSPPVFRIVVCGDVPGEKRFVSTIAKRLFSLGALTRGQRQAAGENMFSARDDLENDYAHSALFNFLSLMAAGRFPECSALDFEAMTGLTLRNEDGSLNSAGIPMTRFMNRLLALRLDMQEILFGNLDQLIEYNIDAAIRTGHHEVGIETLRAKRFEVVDSQVIYTHPETAAKTNCLTVRQVDDIVYQKAQSVYSEWVIGSSVNRMMINDRSKRAAVAVPMSSTMSPDGVPVGRVNLIKPRIEARMSITELNESSWRHAKTKKEWLDVWNNEIEVAGGEVKHTFFLITGLLLPLWTSISDDRSFGFKVVRLRADDGQIYLGREISSQGMAAMSKTFGMRKVEIGGADVYESVMTGGVGVELAGGLRLKRSTVRGEARLELVGHLSRDLSDQVVALGSFKEILGSMVRHFIPTNNQGPDIIEAVRSHLSGPKIKFEKPSYNSQGNQVHPLVLDVLERSKLTTSRLYLPEQLERDLYLATNQVLERIGGEWDRSSKSHSFPDIDLKGMLEEILDLGTMPDRNPLAYFPTPAPVGRAAIAQLELDGLAEGGSILEPSVGDGALLRALSPYLHGKFNVHAIELDLGRARQAHELGVGEFVAVTDFLTLRTGRVCMKMGQGNFTHVDIPLYDRVLMNPPFSGRGRRHLYVDHVNAAWDLLAPGGILVAILPKSIEFAETRRVAALRELIKESGHIIPLPEKSFHESGTDVSTVLVKMRKSGK